MMQRPLEHIAPGGQSDPEEHPQRPAFGMHLLPKGDMKQSGSPKQVQYAFSTQIPVLQSSGPPHSTQRFRVPSQSLPLGQS
jgi:hypothetical protein